MEQKRTNTNFLVHIGGSEVERKGSRRLDAYAERMSMTIENLGQGEGGIYLNEYYIPKEDIQMDVYGHKYYIRHNSREISIKGELDILDGKGRGLITVNNEKDYFLNIAPWAVYFKVQVSSECGAVYDEDTRQFCWDTQCEDWKDPDHWKADQMVFGYDIYEKEDPILGVVKYFECSFQDLCGEELIWEPEVITSFEMTAQDLLVAALPDCTLPIPGVRWEGPIKSVFPSRMEFQFDTLGARFVGAYQDGQGHVYGVKGEAKEAFCLRKRDLREVFKVAPRKRSLGFSPLTGLDVYGLAGMNPIRVDEHGNSYDGVGTAAMEDFYNLIVVRMDKELREKYISQSVPYISQEVRNIGFDRPDAERFYEKVTKPFLASMLSQSNSKYARQINQIRADAKLSRECAQDETYKRHSDLLYRLEFEKKFPSIRLYLNDQKHVDYSETMKKGFDYIKDRYRAIFKMFTDKEHEQQLANILKEQDGLLNWAIHKKAYWAFQLYYFLITYYLCKLQSKMESGKLGQEVGEEIKNFVALFNMLEGGEPNPDGKTFAGAFMEILQVMQITAVLPEMMDYTSLGEGADLIAMEIFKQFMETYGDSSDSAVREAMVCMQTLLHDRDQCKVVYELFITSVTAYGGIGSWDLIVQDFSNKVIRKYAKISSFMIGSVVMSFASMALSSLLCGKSYDKMNTSEKVMYISGAVQFFMNIVVAVGKGIAHLAFLWKDFSGFFEGLQAVGLINRFEGIYNDAIKRLSSSAAKFLLADASMELEAEAAWYVRVFGNNISDFLNRTVGFIMAVISVVVAALDVVKAKENMVIWMDYLTIASGVLQVIAVITEVAIVGLSIESAILTTFCTACGYLSAVAALAGFVIGIIYYYTHESDPMKEFVDETLEGTGLQMPKDCAIEYFGYSSSEEAQRMNGISIQSLGGYLEMHADGTVGSSKDCNTLNTVFEVRVNEKGEAIFYTTLENEKHEFETWCLGTAAIDHPKATPWPQKPAAREDGTFDPVLMETYENEMKRITWTAECLSIEERSGGVATRAAFTLRNKMNSLYLGFYNGQFIFTAIPPIYSSTAKIMLKFAQIAATGAILCINKEKWILDENSVKQSNMAFFQTRVAAPVSFCVQPPLQEAFGLETNDKGTSVRIYQKKGAKLERGEWNYTLEAVNTVVGGKKSGTSIPFSICVAAGV